MNKILYLTAAIALVGLMAALHATPNGDIGGSALPNSHLPELEYLKSVNRVGPPQDPQLLFVLMAEYANANEQAEGAANQNTDPFKFILYSAKIGEQVPQMGVRDTAASQVGR
jgi:hypothetical protein